MKKTIIIITTIIALIAVFVLYAQKTTKLSVANRNDVTISVVQKEDETEIVIKPKKKFVYLTTATDDSDNYLIYQSGRFFWEFSAKNNIVLSYKNKSDDFVERPSGSKVKASEIKKIIIEFSKNESEELALTPES
ncbi:hypothetical protein [Lapidilactobacillus salsurivasis]